MVDDIAARVVAVLRRAESLFAASTDATTVMPAERLREVAEAHRGLGSTELGGAGITGHRELVEQSLAGVTGSAAADELLAAQLTAAAARHQRGESRAQHFHADAAALPERLAALSGTAAGELATLTSLRAKLAGMQQLVTEHAGQDAATAAEIRALDYRGRR